MITHGKVSANTFSNGTQYNLFDLQNANRALLGFDGFGVLKIRWKIVVPNVQFGTSLMLYIIVRLNDGSTRSTLLGGVTPDGTVVGGFPIGDEDLIGHGEILQYPPDGIEAAWLEAQADKVDSSSMDVEFGWSACASLKGTLRTGETSSRWMVAL